MTLKAASGHQIIQHLLTLAARITAPSIQITGLTSFQGKKHRLDFLNNLNLILNAQTSRTNMRDIGVSIYIYIYTAIWRYSNLETKTKSNLYQPTIEMLDFHLPEVHTPF